MTSQHTPGAEAHYQAIRRLVFRIASFTVGAGILFHEVWLTKDSEVVLDFIALWLMGFPTADLAAHITTNILGQSTVTRGDDSPSPKKGDGSGS